MHVKRPPSQRGVSGSSLRQPHDGDLRFDDAEWPADVREREYSPSSVIGGDYRPFVQAYRQRSLEARDRAQASGGKWSRLAYGPGPTQTIDVCRPAHAAGGVPLLMFIHGGYWQELGSIDSLFAADDCLAQGWAFAAIDYTLAPAATVRDIVDECVQALQTLHAQAALLGIDRRRIVLAGSSAGAHLAAVTALRTTANGAAVGSAVRALVLVSGIYALAPLVGTSINEALGLDVDEAEALSPLLMPLAGLPESIICWGAVETRSFKAQGRAFSAALRQAGVACETFEVAGRNHFDVVLDLCRPSSPLGARVASMLARV